jgi:hypothetical protein
MIVNEVLRNKFGTTNTSKIVAQIMEETWIKASFKEIDKTDVTNSFSLLYLWQEKQIKQAYLAEEKEKCLYIIKDLLAKVIKWWGYLDVDKVRLFLWENLFWRGYIHSKEMEKKNDITKGAFNLIYGDKGQPRVNVALWWGAKVDWYNVVKERGIYWLRLGINREPIRKRLQEVLWLSDEESLRIS